ncbi:MAG: Nif3-like dinuclear metal center hexameric protein [Pseudomonadota bacterium]
MEVSKITELIERIAPLPAACSWDNSGVQVAALCQDITSLAVCLDPTPNAVEQAMALGAQYILSHHPLLMKPAYLNKLGSYHQVVRTLMTHDAWLYSAHTSLDASANGPVSWLAKELGLQDCTILEQTYECPCAPSHNNLSSHDNHSSCSSDSSASKAQSEIFGLGMVGTLATPLSWNDFIARMQSLVPLDTATLCGPRPSMIQRIGYCTGSGSSLASRAFAKGADIFITGDVKYHTALDTLGPILDVGHFSLEEEMMKRLASQLQASLGAEITVHFLASADPLRPLGLSL